MSLMDEEKENTIDNQTLNENVNEEKPEERELSEDEIAYKKFEEKWYVLHTFSGYENVAKENLETVVEKFNLQDRIFDIVIPMEDVVEEKNGKKKFVQRKSMPCYILVKMKYDDDLWHNVTRTRGITGFVGPKGRPLALTNEEVMKLGIDRIKVETNVKVGDKVEIVSGALNGMVGSVVGLNVEDSTASVVVEMFGRDTTVDVELSQVHKINN